MDMRPTFYTDPHFRLQFVRDFLFRLLTEGEVPLQVGVKGIIKYIDEHEGEDRDSERDAAIRAFRPLESRLVWEQNLNAEPR